MKQLSLTLSAALLLASGAFGSNIAKDEDHTEADHATVQDADEHGHLEDHEGGHTQQQYTKGVVKKLDEKKGKVTIIHEKLEALGMPAMTMVFRFADDAMMEQLQPGNDIEFIAERVDGKLTVTDLK